MLQPAPGELLFEVQFCFKEAKEVIEAIEGMF
jgi:hypothetical protein